MVYFVVSPKMRGFLYAMVGAIMFSSKAIFIKLGYQIDMSFLDLLVVRGLFAVPVFICIALYYVFNSKTESLSGVDKVSIIGLGFLGYYLSSVLDFFGLNFIPASLERVILYIYPTIVVLIGYVMFGRRLHPMELFSLVVTYIGICVAVLNQGVGAGATDIFRGCMFVGLSAVSYGLFIVFSGEIIPKIGSVRYISLVMLVSYSFIGCHYMLLQGFVLPSFTSETVRIGMALGIICTVIPTLCLAQAIYLIGSSNTALIGGVGPVSTIVLASVFLGESLLAVQIVGVALVIVGVGSLQFVRQ